ncbi:hypothetical protein GCM10008090_24160 [Arenicella chitinivorans]|uniref:Uncharacterized protein n=1 Tax=Arenicella chitinivorans TaxID=1329800 RepID=A0A918VP10_9GAMM|nr:deoxyribonuclease II family protein [Arenicella chitinivorans]GHA13595.1 hypothetical protein GCM10008090_24160 [Arenicella chitinivorans]
MDEYHAEIRKLARAWLIILSIAALCQACSADQSTNQPLDGVALDSVIAPKPLIHADKAVDWWFSFKFNAAKFPGCANQASRACPFGGQPQNYRYGYSQQFVAANSTAPTLSQGQVCLGDSDQDPLGATFAQIYEGNYYYVVWNDQFYEQPKIVGCENSCSAPWGHAKGVVAWNDDGEGLVLQVTTPAWPGAGNQQHPRQAGGNTLGCVSLDDDIAVAQHFFALRLSPEDLAHVIAGLANASVVTDVGQPQLVRNGGPDSIQLLVQTLGKQSNSTDVINVTLSSGVRFISKPSALHVPPWQLVSAQLGGIDLRTATWWTDPAIPSTDRSTPLRCWNDQLGAAGAVSIATSGSWNGTDFSLKGGLGNEFNHAKFAVNDGARPSIAIFGDMNQQGALAPGSAYPNQKCSSSQNGRGGTFYVVENAQLAASLADLIRGDTAPLAPNSTSLQSK